MSIKSVLITCTIVVITLIASELGARIWLWTPGTTGPEMTGDSLGNSRYAYEPDAPGDLIPGQNGHWLVWWRRPYSVVTNSQGFRSLEEPQPGFRQIVALGDSQTFGPYVATEDTWPAWTQAELRRIGALGKIQVHNGGISGYTIADEVAWLREKGLALKPDMIVLGVFENDILDYRRILEGRGMRPVASSDRLGEFEGFARDLRTDYLRNLALYALASQLRRKWDLYAANVDIMRGEGDAARERPEVEAARFKQYAELYERDFREFVRLTKEAGILLAVVALPSSSVLAEGQTAEVGPLAGRLCTELDVPFLDLMPAFEAAEDPAQKFYLLQWSAELNGLTGNGHLSREGHYEIGRRVAAWLAALR